MCASLRRGQGLMRGLNNLQILQINTERGNGMCKFCTYHFPLAILFQFLSPQRTQRSQRNGKPATTDAHNLSRKAVTFGIILTVRNGNASDLIAPRREPPRRGRQDRPSVANRSLRTTTLQKTKHGLQDGTLLSIWGVALACVCLGCRRP